MANPLPINGDRGNTAANARQLAKQRQASKDLLRLQKQMRYVRLQDERTSKVMESRFINPTDL